MKNKITAITEKLPIDTSIPDGLYNGVWGGYAIELRMNGKTYELTTEKGVKGIGIKVIVEVKDGIATFQEINN